MANYPALLLIFAGMRILMVCLGNICRSPLAEGILKAKAASAGFNWTVESAGTNRYHTGEAPHRLSQKIAMQNGIDISGHRARTFVKEDMADYDRIFSMAADVLEDMRSISGNKYDETKVELLMNELHPGLNEDVPDPYYGGEEGYHLVFEMMKQACDSIIEKYATQ